MTEAKVRSIIHQEGRLPYSIGQREDLFAAGLDSIAMVNIMMAIEQEFDIEFPDRLLNRSSFATVAALVRVVDELRSDHIAGAGTAASV